ncbi:hypothetical protein Goshw_007085 [Gossypium schwendimanii]|uniref:DUF4283 domain-containing protein n=1 Tax=Gossypium schwendimanii TaxID=34291 RepID=A0A7J9N395_GOSSC|nr:hypothetical protein [Gossypium schwendimanii]
MYKVLKSIWFTNDEVCFVALNEEVFLVKFESIEDRMRIMSMMPWLFNQCLFVMLPFIKVQELDGYDFNINLFWIRIFNIPLEQMDRQMAIEVGKAIGDVVAINWRDREGGMEGCMAVSTEGHSGGLVMLWKNDTDVEGRHDGKGRFDCWWRLNVIIDEAEKGGRRKSRAAIVDFRDVMEELNLVDL